MAPSLKNPTLPPFLDEAISDHLARLRRTIVHRAEELALQDVRRSSWSDAPGTDDALEISPIQCLRAIEEIAPGTLDPSSATAKVNFWEAFLESVSPVTLICAILTIAFASFGLIIIHKEGKGDINPTAYLDIAKIFAGAIVGSASAAMVHTAKRSRARR